MMGFQKRCSEGKSSKDERWSVDLFETSCCILGRRASISLLLTCLSPIASLSHLLFHSSSLVPIGPRLRGLLKTILKCRLSSTNRSRGQNIYNLPDGFFQLTNSLSLALNILNQQSIRRGNAECATHAHEVKAVMHSSNRGCLVV